MNFFPKPYTRSRKKIQVELDLADYATKSVLKKKTGVDISDFAKKV